ncbi:MAG: glycosyltransferase family 4 protein [Bacteroidales bacterium]|nr:glycosyltransferase family 4 protein [Bacteroidales bacterium]
MLVQNNTKKILIAIPSFTYGGAENHGFVIAKVLKSMGYKPVMFSFSKRTDAVLMYEKEGIACIQYDKPILIDDAWYIKIYKAVQFIWFLRKQAIHTVISKDFIANINFGIVWKYSNITQFYWGQSGSSYKPNIAKLEKKAVSNCQHFICNSAWVKKAFINHYSLQHKVSQMHVIHNAVFERPVQKNREQWRTKLQIEHDAVVFTMTANFFPEKDYETLLYAFRKLLDKNENTKIYLIIAGNAPGISPEKLRMKALAFDLKLQDTIRFIDATPDVFGLYAASDVGVLSTLSEGFSNSLLEYMWCGLPVVATDIPPNREALPQECHSFLFEPKNVEDCAEKLNMFVENATMRIDVGNVNKEYARRNYTVEKLKQAYSNIFNT